MRTEQAFTAAVGQITPACFKPKENVSKIREYASDAAGRGAKLMVFGEMAVTGYPGWRPDPLATTYKTADYVKQLHAWPSLELFHASETIPGPSTDALSKAAKENDIFIITGIGEADPAFQGIIYNTAVVIGSDGRIIGKNRKVHIYGWEYFYWKRGSIEDIRVYDTEVGRIGVPICYDLMFPEHTRLLDLMGEQIQCQVIAGSDGWETYLQPYATTRATEGGVFVIASNLVGKEENKGEPIGVFKGNSCIVEPFGNILAKAGQEEGIILADINLDRIMDYRASGAFTLGLDRRDDLYSLTLNRREGSS